MSTNTRPRRLPSSCVNCRRRKIRCDKSSQRDCRRCERLGLECVVTDEVVARPFYHTSKERYELMATIVRHFTPGTPLNVEDLREYVSTLSSTTNELSFPNSRQEPSPQPSASRPSTFIPTPDSLLQPYVPIGSDETIYGRIQVDTESSLTDECTPMSDCSLVGEFLPDATLQRRFDGASSCSVVQSRVCSQIPDKFSRLVLLQRENAIDLRDGHPIPEVPVTALPPRSLCEQCGVAFLNQINSVVYILSPEQFFNALETAYRDGSTTASTQVIIHLIVALISNSSESFQKARLQMETVLEEGSLHSIQAMMLMCLYRLSRNQRHLGWVMLGNAIRLTQSLGLHFRMEKDSLIVAEQKTRLWWSLYELDQWTSTILGQSPEMSVEFRTAPEPCDSFTTGITTPPMYAAASARLARFLSKAMSCIYLQKIYRVREVDALLHEMNTWWTGLPDHLTRSTPSASVSRTTLYFRMRYHYVLALITRPFLLNSTLGCGKTSGHVDICNENNDKSIKIILEMQSKDLLVDAFWFDIHHILSTSLILFLRILKSPSSTGLQEKAESMRHVLQEHPGKIQTYADQCLKEILEDIRMLYDSDQVMEPNFDLAMTNLDLWGDLDLFKLNCTDL